MKDVLLTVSGTIDPEIEAKTAQGLRPEADYAALARKFDADLIDYPAARRTGGLTGRFLERVGGPNLGLAWACFRQRRRYRVIFSDGEQVGLPLALLFKFFHFGKRPAHLMIAHILSVPKKMLFFDWLHLHSRIDRFIVYATWQKRFIQSRWKVPSEMVVFTPFMVDADFFSPQRGDAGRAVAGLGAAARPQNGAAPALISTAGLEFRDYPTLLAAVRGLDVQLVVAAASPWSKRSDTTAGQEIPENVSVRRYTQYELRDLYAASRFVVMPLFEVEFQAGVTAILEAMAMGKAVICTRTPGQTDIVVEGETGLYVPPGDPQALRSAILHLLENPGIAEAMGQAGRRRVLQELSLECYAARLARCVQEARNSSNGRASN